MNNENLNKESDILISREDLLKKDLKEGERNG